MTKPIEKNNDNEAELLVAFISVSFDLLFDFTIRGIVYLKLRRLKIVTAATSRTAS